MPTVKQILGETESFIRAKQASFTGKQALAGEDPNSMPGSEHDKPVPAEAKTPDKEVDDGTQGPKGSHGGTDGAGDDSPVTRGHVMDAETPAETPASKPLLSADANAKTAEMCNDLLTDIRNYRRGVGQKQAEAGCAAPAAAPAAKPEDKKPEAKPEDKKAEAPAAPAAKPEEKQGGLNMELTAEFLQKIGAILLSTEEGTAFVDAQLRKHAGAEQARELMGFIVEQNAEAEKLAAAEQGSADAAAMIQETIYRAGYAAAMQQQKRASIARTIMSKLGQEVADAGIDQLMAGGAEGGMDVPPEAMGAAPASGDAAGLGMEQEITPEDVAAALDMLVQQGQLQPQDAEAILAQLGLGAAPAAAAPAEAAPAAPAAAAPAEAAPAAPADKPAEKSEPKKDEPKKEESKKEDSAE